MFSRLRGLLSAPHHEWDTIAASTATARVTCATWVLPLALLPFAVEVLRVTLFAAIFGLDTTFAVAPALVADAAGHYLFLLVWIWAVAWAADRLAPRFGGQSDFARAYAAVAYSLAPAFVLSLLTLLPLVGILSLGGLVWAVWLLRLGLPRLMHAPEARASGYTASVTAIAILLALLALLMPSCAGGGAAEAGDGVAAALEPAPAGQTVPGGRGAGTQSPDERLAGADKQGSGALNLDDLKGLSVQDYLKSVVDPEKVREMERVARDAARVTTTIPFKPAEPSALQALMPTEACGVPRVSIKSMRSVPGDAAGNVAGAIASLGGQSTGEFAQVSAEFGRAGGVFLRMDIGDRNGLANAMRQLRKIMPERNDTTARGYLRFRQDGETFIDERWDSGRKEARFAALIADRFVVSAIVGGVEEPDCAQAAARAVDWGKLVSLAPGEVR